MSLTGPLEIGLGLKEFIKPALEVVRKFSVELP